MVQKAFRPNFLIESQAETLLSSPLPPLLPSSPNQIPMAATAMDHDGGEVVTPGELLGNSSLLAGLGAYADGRCVRASITGHRRLVPPPPGSTDQVGFS